MSSVSNSSDHFSYYQNALNQLTDDNRRDMKRASEREDEHIASVQEKYSDDRKSLEEQHEKDVQEVKDNYNRAFAEERDQNKEDRTELTKKLTYDNAGRLQNDEIRIQNKRLQAEHEKEIERLKNSFSRSEAKLRDRAVDFTKDQKLEFTENYRKLAEENSDSVALLKKQTIESESSLKNQNQKYQDLAEKRLENTQERANQSRNEALTAQAKAYQSTLERNSQDHESQIKELKTATDGSPTGRGSRMVTPEVHDRIRNKAIEEYTRKMADQDRQNESQKSDLQLQLNRQRGEIISDARNRETSRHQADLAEAQHMRTEFKYNTEQILDSTSAQLREQNREFDKTNLIKDKTNQRINDANRRQMVEQIEGTQEEARVRQNSIKQESDIQSRSEKREANTRHNETVRAYEKQIADMKLTHQAEMAEQKANLDSTIRENERRHRAELDGQNRIALARLSEAESMAKERERNMLNQHEEQIEKIRNTHAQQLKKKS